MHDGQEPDGAMIAPTKKRDELSVKTSALLLSENAVKMERLISETGSCATTTTKANIDEQSQVQQEKKAEAQMNQQEQMCAGCQAPIRDKFLFSVIDLLWHANCVQCCVCSRQLNDRCFTYDNKLYCAHDYWRRFGPKCYACREPIEKSELVQRIKGSRVYHLKCFTCAHCKRRLEQGEQLHLVDNEQRLLCKQDFVQHVATGATATTTRPSKPMVRGDSAAFSFTQLNNSCNNNEILNSSSSKKLKRSSLTALDNMLGRRQRSAEDEEELGGDEDDEDEEEEAEEEEEEDDELDEDELTRELDADDELASCYEQEQNDENNAKRQSLSTSAITNSAAAASATKKRRRRKRLDASAASSHPMATAAAASTKRTKRNGESILNGAAAQQQQHSASSILANMQPTSGQSNSSSSPSSSSSSSSSNHSTASSSNSTSALHHSHLHHHHHHHHAHQQQHHHAHSSVVNANQQQQQQQQQQQSSGANHQTSGAGAGHKPTRVRTVLNEKQLQTLRDCYAHNPRPDALMKEQLVDMTGLSPRVIRVWFQNKRCKDKKKSILYKQMQQHEKDGRHLAGLTHIRGVSMVASSPIQFGDETPATDITSPTQQQQSVQSPASSVQVHTGTGNSTTTTTETTTTNQTNATTAQNNSPALDIHAYQPPWKGLVEYAKDSAITQQQQQQQQQLPDPSSPRYQQLIGQIHGYQTTTTANEHQEAHQVIEQQQQQQFPANYQMAPPAPPTPAHLHHLHHAHSAPPPPPPPIGHHQLHQFQH